MKFPLLKIIYDDCDIKISSKYSISENKEEDIQNLDKILSKDPNIKCYKCQKEMSTFDFSFEKENKEKLICDECYKTKVEKIDKENYISLDKYISTCAKHQKKYELFCLNCNMNMCPECQNEHLDLNSTHEFIIFENIVEEKEIIEKTELCQKLKYLCEIFKNVSKIKGIESKFKERKKYKNISERFSRENKFAEIIISTFSHFYEKKALCYELISNFNEIKFHKILKDIDIKEIIDIANNLDETSFHVIMQSPGIIEKKKNKIILVSEKERIYSKKSFDSEIRGVIELKDGYYLAASKGGIIGIFDSEKLDLKQSFRLEGISNIFHLEKIKDENSDLIAVASNLNEIIIISISKKCENDNSNNKEDIFAYKYECRKKEHTDKINRIIQLSNGLIVSSSEDKFIIFWQLIKNDNIFDLQSISKVKIDLDVHILIECPYTNELICNYRTIDLNSFTLKRNLPLRLQDKDFNCSVCLFKEKYIASVVDCDFINVLNIENENEYYISAKYDYVEAVYSIDNETFCLCTQDLYNIFRGKYSQQFKFEEDDFVEVGKITATGICNCYITDSKKNFVMGDMSGKLTKFLA